MSKLTDFIRTNGNGAIMGRVVYDVNADGISYSGKPVIGTITIYGNGHKPAFIDKASAIIRFSEKGMQLSTDAQPQPHTIWSNNQPFVLNKSEWMDFKASLFAHLQSPNAIVELEQSLQRIAHNIDTYEPGTHIYANSPAAPGKWEPLHRERIDEINVMNRNKPSQIFARADITRESMYPPGSKPWHEKDKPEPFYGRIQIDDGTGETLAVICCKPQGIQASAPEEDDSYGDSQYRIVNIEYGKGEMPLTYDKHFRSLMHFLTQRVSAEPENALPIIAEFFHNIREQHAACELIDKGIS